MGKNGSNQGRSYLENKNEKTTNVKNSKQRENKNKTHDIDETCPRENRYRNTIQDDVVRWAGAGEGGSGGSEGREGRGGRGGSEGREKGRGRGRRRGRHT